MTRQKTENRPLSLSRGEYDYTTGSLDYIQYITSYYYDDNTWGDLLTSYDGKTITYDNIGNPLSDGEWTYSWQHGRQLASMTKGSTTWTYTYDANGMRTRRTDGLSEYTYVYNGDKLVQFIAGTYEYYDLSFTYDASGTPLTITARGETYYYITNLQGDVIGIKNSSGQQIVTYTYDSWGNDTGHTNTYLAEYNPLRYRGYVYDDETGLYYVGSRYYDPEIGRWINADGYVSTGQDLTGYNMFAYCGNNPVNRVDPTGQFWKELWDAFTQTIQQASGYFAAAAGVSQVDTPVPGPADVASGILLIGGVLVCAGIATYTTITAPAPSISIPKAEEKVEAIVIPKEPDSPVIFPVDPNAFNPVGLVKVPRAGTTNGAFISWMDPLTNTEVFRWDENPNYPNGPHYHINNPIYRKAKVHFYPGNVVPEPYATIYFPFG